MKSIFGTIRSHNELSHFEYETKRIWNEKKKINIVATAEDPLITFYLVIFD